MMQTFVINGILETLLQILLAALLIIICIFEDIILTHIQLFLLFKHLLRTNVESWFSEICRLGLLMKIVYKKWFLCTILFLDIIASLWILIHNNLHYGKLKISDISTFYQIDLSKILFYKYMFIHHIKLIA